MPMIPTPRAGQAWTPATDTTRPRRRRRRRGRRPANAAVAPAATAGSTPALSSPESASVVPAATGGMTAADLLDDLATLIDEGLIVAVPDGHSVRYAVNDSVPDVIDAGDAIG